MDRSRILLRRLDTAEADSVIETLGIASTVLLAALALLCLAFHVQL